MKKIMKISSRIISIFVIFLFTSCGDTTTHDDGNTNANAADSAVGNSEASNTIYRDSGNIRNATETSGGTANPSNKNPPGMKVDSLRK
jgi:hypothetical protein